MGCNYEPPCSPERAAAALPCAAARDLSASAYWDRLHWNFILWISPWNMDVLSLKGNTENVAQCTERQKKARAAGLAGAKSPPSPASRPQQWSKADTKNKSENKASVCCEFPVHHCFLHCLRYLCILNFFHPSGTASNMSWPHFCTLPPPMIYLSHLFIYNHISFTAIHLSLLHFCLPSSNYKTTGSSHCESTVLHSAMCQLVAECNVFFFLLNDAPCNNKEGLVRDLLI